MPISQIKTICEISVREWSIRRFLAARMDFFLRHFRTVCSFYYIILCSFAQVKYQTVIVPAMDMISKTSLYK